MTRPCGPGCQPRQFARNLPQLVPLHARRRPWSSPLGAAPSVGSAPTTVQACCNLSDDGFLCAKNRAGPLGGRSPRLLLPTETRQGVPYQVGNPRHGATSAMDADATGSRDRSAVKLTARFSVTIASDVLRDTQAFTRRRSDMVVRRGPLDQAKWRSRIAIMALICVAIFPSIGRAPHRERQEVPRDREQADNLGVVPHRQCDPQRAFLGRHRRRSASTQPSPSPNRAVLPEGSVHDVVALFLVHGVLTFVT